MFFTDKGYHIYLFEQVASKLLRIIITLDHHPANKDIFQSEGSNVYFDLGDVILVLILLWFVVSHASFILT